MATDYQMRAVRYDLLGARRGPVEDMGLTVNTSESDKPVLQQLQVAAEVAAGWPEVVEIAVEVFTDGGWVEPDDCRFIAVADDANENDPANVKTYRGEGLWAYDLSKGILEDSPQRAVVNRPTPAMPTLTGISVTGDLFTKTGHDLVDGQRVYVLNTGTYKGSGFEAGDYLFARHITGTTFRLSGSRWGSMKSTGNGTFTGVQLRPVQDRILADDHNFQWGEKVRFESIGNAKGVKLDEDYYVAGRGANWFTVSSQRGGLSIDLGPSRSGLSVFVTLDGSRKFTGFTPGRIIRYAMGEARARGWAPAPLVETFTSTHDSNGQPWAETVDIEFTAGMSLWAMIRALVEAGVCRVRATGRTLQLLNPIGEPPAVRPAVKVGVAGQVRVQRSYEDSVTDVKVRGENRVLASATQGVGPVLGVLGRLEEYQRASGVNSTAYARRIAVRAAAGRGGIATGFVATENPQGDTARPALVAFKPGDYVTFPFSSSLRTGLVLEVQLRKAGDGSIEATTTLEQKRASKQLRALAKSAKVTGGTSLAGSSTFPATVVVSGAVPAAPTLTVEPVTATFTGTGAAAATARASVTPVLATVEGAEIDAPTAQVFVRVAGAEQPQLWATLGATEIDLLDLAPGVTYYVSARAVAADGTAGVLSDEVELVTARPASLLLPPTIPVVGSALGSVSVRWDGLMRSSAEEGGTTTPTASLAYVTAQVSTETGWVDRGQQLATGGQAAQLEGLLIGSPVTVRLVAVDTAGNRSEASEPVTVTVAGVDAGSVTGGLKKAIIATLDEYTVTSSATEPPPADATWSTDTPDWEPGSYIWRRTRNTHVDETTSYTSPAVITGADGTPGEDAVLLRVSSSRGTAFKNSAIGTVLTATVFKGAQQIVDLTTLWAVFGTTAYLEWLWRRVEEDDWGVISSADPRLSQGGFALTISPADVDEKTDFICRLHT